MKTLERSRRAVITSFFGGSSGGAVTRRFYRAGGGTATQTWAFVPGSRTGALVLER